MSWVRLKVLTLNQKCEGQITEWFRLDGTARIKLWTDYTEKRRGGK